MIIKSVSLALAAGLMSSMAFADVTVITKYDFQTLQAMPMGFGQTFKAPWSNPSETMRAKGSKCLTIAGNLGTLIDLARQDVTLMDNARKVYARVTLAQYGQGLVAAMPKPNPAAQGTVKMKARTSVRHTGRTENIQGIQAEEREITMLVETEISAGGQLLSGPLLRWVFQVWTATHEEMVGNPALRELATFYTVRASLANPIEMLQNTARNFTDGVEGMTVVIDELRKGNATIVRGLSEMYMPAVGAALEKLAAQRGLPLTAGFDPNGPVTRFTQTVVEFSTATVDDAAFQLPPDYTPISAEELTRGLATVR